MRKFLVIVFVWFSFSAIAQNENIFADRDSIFETASVSQSWPNHPLAMFHLKVPFTYNFLPENKFSASYTIGNTWRPTIYLIDKNYGRNIDIRDRLIEYYYPKYWGNALCEDKPDFVIPEIEPFQTAKRFRSDGIIRKIHLNFSKAISKNGQITVLINGGMLAGGNSFIDWPVRDRTIENFHQIFTKKRPDPYNRQIRPYNQAGLRLFDSENEVRFNKGDSFFGTLNFNYQHFKKILRDETKAASIQLGGTISYPLNSIHGFVSVAPAINCNYIQRYKNKNLFQISTGIGIIYNQLFKVKSTLNYYDKPFQTNINIFTAYTFSFSRLNLLFGMEFNSQSSYFTKNKYTYMFESIGGKDGSEALGGFNTWMLTIANQYLGLLISIRKKKSPLSYGLKVFEDGNFFKSLLFATYGSNGQDIGVEMFLTYSL